MRITLTSNPGRFKDTRVAQLQLHLVVVEESGTVLRVRSNAPKCKQHNLTFRFQLTCNSQFTSVRLYAHLHQVKVVSESSLETGI